MEVLSKLWKAHAEDWIYAPLGKSQAPEDTLYGDVAPESAYISVWLKSARVIDLRKGLKKFYGAVHSYICLPHRSKQDVEFNVVTAPTALQNIDAGGIDRVIQLNKPLLGPVPYAGGALKMEVGLFSVASSDLAAPYLKILETLSEIAGVSYIGVALPFARPIMEGVNLLAGSAAESILEIGFSTTQQPPRLGCYVAIRAPKETLDVKKLSVDPLDFRLLDADRKPLEDYPYLVVEIRSEPRRHDWFSIPEVLAAYQEIQAEYRRGQQSTIEEALTAFRRIVLTCNDLLFEDAVQLSNRVRAKYEELGPQSLAFRSAVKSRLKVFPDLREIDLYDGK